MTDTTSTVENQQDEQQPAQQSAVDQNAPAERTYTEKDLQGIISKRDELLGENRKLKDANDRREREKAEAEKKALEEQNNFKAVAELNAKERDEALARVADLEAQINGSKIKDKAIELGNKYGSNDENKALLAELLQLKHIELSESGEAVPIGFNSFEDMVRVFEANGQYASLRKGNQSVAGNLNGGNGLPANKKPQEMNDSERKEFFRNDPEGFKKAFNL